MEKLPPVAEYLGAWLGDFSTAKGTGSPYSSVIFCSPLSDKVAAKQSVDYQVKRTKDLT